MTAPVHLTAEQISDLHAGALAATEAMELNAHLASCEACQQVRDDLLAVIAMLADEAAAPVAMPDDVADALDAALRRASVERTTGDAGRRRPLRWLAGAAAAVTVVSFGVAGLKALPTQSDSSTDGAAAGFDPPKSVEQARGDVAGAPSRHRDGMSFESGDLDSLSAAQVPDQAKRLASLPYLERDSEFRFQASTLGCAEPITGGPSMVIRYQGRLAFLTIDRTTRGVTVYDCATGTRVLYTGDY